MLSIGRKQAFISYLSDAAQGAHYPAAWQRADIHAVTSSQAGARAAGPGQRLGGGAGAFVVWAELLDRPLRDGWVTL